MNDIKYEIKCRLTTIKERTCDTCKYSSTDGFYAPNYWCNKDKHHEDRGGEMYNSWVSRVGTVCDDFESKPIPDKEYDISTYNISTREGIQNLGKEIFTIIEDIIDEKIRGEKLNEIKKD